MKNVRRQIGLALCLWAAVTLVSAGESAGGSIGDAAGKTWHGVKEGSKEAWQATKEGSKEAWEATKKGTQEVWDATKEGFGKARKSVGEAISGE